MNEDHLIITEEKTENEKSKKVKWWNMFVQTEEKYLKNIMKLL